MGKATEAKKKDGKGRDPVCSARPWNGLVLISEPELLCLALEQASWELALEGPFGEIQASATWGEAWVCLGPLVPTPTQEPHPQNTSLLSERGHGGLLILGFVF